MNKKVFKECVEIACRILKSKYGIKVSSDEVVIVLESIRELETITTVEYNALHWELVEDGLSVWLISEDKYILVAYDIHGCVHIEIH